MPRLFAVALGAALSAIPAVALAQHQHMQMPPTQTPPPAEATPSQSDPAPTQTPTAPHGAPDPHVANGMAQEASMGGAMPMTSALGPWPMTRDASGTSWQPDASEHAGVHAMAGDWMIMSHAQLNLVWDDQSGPRGDDKAFVSGMLMTSARRELADGSSLNLRAMISPDPLMGRDGYPLLLAAGETADGVTPLVDRQHPHELVMELSASWARPLTDHDSVFAYFGYPGEPAFGPPAFMHRMSAMDSPEAPITHHWLDSTHIVFGVTTLGWVHDGFKLEASAFKGREPDENRWDFDPPRLDSAALRASWNPSAEWSLQASWADVRSPEQLEPDRDETKWSASAIHTRRVGADGWWSSTLAWGRKDGDHAGARDGWLLETALHPDDRWTLFARAERIETDELEGLPGGGHGPIRTVGKASVGAIRDWRLAPHIRIGVGGLYSVNAVPAALEPSYGGDPRGVMAFFRIKID